MVRDPRHSESPDCCGCRGSSCPERRKCYRIFAPLALVSRQPPSMRCRWKARSPRPSLAEGHRTAIRRDAGSQADTFPDWTDRRRCARSSRFLRAAGRTAVPVTTRLQPLRAVCSYIATLGANVRFCRISRVWVGQSGWWSVMVAGAGLSARECGRGAVRRAAGTGRPCAGPGRPHRRGSHGRTGSRGGQVGKKARGGTYTLAREVRGYYRAKAESARRSAACLRGSGAR